MLRESGPAGIKPATCKSQVQSPTAEPPRNTKRPYCGETNNCSRGTPQICWQTRVYPCILYAYVRNFVSTGVLPLRGKIPGILPNFQTIHSLTARKGRSCARADSGNIDWFQNCFNNAMPSGQSAWRSQTVVGKRGGKA